VEKEALQWQILSPELKPFRRYFKQPWDLKMTPFYSILELKI
jgi:hypothetical protein